MEIHGKNLKQLLDPYSILETCLYRNLEGILKVNDNQKLQLVSRENTEVLQN